MGTFSELHSKTRRNKRKGAIPFLWCYPFFAIVGISPVCGWGTVFFGLLLRRRECFQKSVHRARACLLIINDGETKHCVWMRVHVCTACTVGGGVPIWDRPDSRCNKSQDKGIVFPWYLIFSSIKGHFIIKDQLLMTIIEIIH
jgi:hypothetical protein